MAQGQLLSLPAAAAGKAPASSASAWAFGSWVEVSSSLSTGIIIYGLEYTIPTSPAAADTTYEQLFEIGTGASSSEVTKVQLPGSYRADTITSASNGLGYWMPKVFRSYLPEPFLVNLGTRVAVRATDSIASAITYAGVKILYRESTAPTVALNSPSDTASTGDLTPTLNFTGTDAESDEYEAHIQVSTSTFSDVAFDSMANSGVIASDNEYSFNITVASNSNRMLLVGVSCRDNDNPGNRDVTGITADGQAMTLMKALSSTDGDGDDTRAEIWGILAPNTGTIAIVVTHTGVVDHAGAFAVSIYNATQSLTPNVTGQDEDTQSSATTSPDIALTTTITGCFMFDVGYNQSGSDLTVGAGQTAVAQLGVNAGGDRAISSYEIAGLKGSNSMTWTASPLDAFVQVAVAIAPNGIMIDALSSTDAGFTAGHPFASGAATDYTVQSDLTDTTTYYWRVRGIDPSGSNTYGSWSTTRSFTVNTAGGVAVKTLAALGVG